MQGGINFSPAEAMLTVVISETSDPKIKEALLSIDATLKRIEIILQNLQEER